MAVPKVNLRTRKWEKGISYFIDFTINVKRSRIVAGTIKKTALEISQKTQIELYLGYFDIYALTEKTISL